jgi:hypothetical protein
MKKARSEQTMNNRKVIALKNRNEVKEQLTEAIRNLRDASARVDLCAHILVEQKAPFAEHKFLNIVKKEISQLEKELSVFLGKGSIDFFDVDSEEFASLRILRNIRKTVAGMSGEKASECPIGGCVLKFSGACRLGIVPKECPLKGKRAV